MQIELIGCTNSGKSTLLNGILKFCHEHDIDATTGDEFVLKLTRLNWIKGYYLRTLLLDIISLFSVLFTSKVNLKFTVFVLKVIFNLPNEISWYVKLNLLRNTIKKLGIYHFVRRFSSEGKIVLMDEGTVHSAHYLFVNLNSEPPTDDMSTFGRLAPLPDIVIYLKQDERLLIEKTMARGHKRIPENSFLMVEQFVRRAVKTFDFIANDSNVQPKVLTVDSEYNILDPQGFRTDPAYQTAFNILQLSLKIVNQSTSG